MQGRILNFRAALSLLCAVLPVAGCTVYPEKKPATLKTTTSSEEYERIFWKDVKAKDPGELNAILSDTLVYTDADGTTVDKSGAVTALMNRDVADYALGAISLKPNGPDMVLAYTASAKDKTGEHKWRVTSVWQQTKSGGWIMIARTDTVCTQASTSC